MNWIFKADNIKFSENFETATFSIRQKRNFTGKKDESVLILDNKENDWKFTYHYRINKINIETINSKLKELFVELSLVEKYEDEKYLFDYIYSFKRITDYNNPLKHINYKYNRLSKVEFNVIDKNEIYYTRTILGTIFNSLHKDHQEQYLSYLAENNPSLLINSTDLTENLKFITEYVKVAILKPAQYLTESDKILNKILTQEELIQIAFADPDNDAKEKVELIHQQAQLINNNLTQISENRDNEINIEQFILDEKNEKFSKIFKNTGLPFKLK